MSQFTFLPTLADGLLYQHELLATAKIDQAVPGDRGELLGDPIYERVLDGLRLVARHAALPLLDHLLNWRKDALAKAARAGSDLMVIRKRLAVEQIFLETAAQLVSRGSSPLSERQADALEKLAFDWILNAEIYVDARFPELARARDRVTGLGAVIIGALGETRLPHITDRYLREVEVRLPKDLNSARQEIVQLTEGMRRLRLPTDTSQQLAAATDFLARLHPLKHTAVQRKSFVHHAMCEMLGAILGGLAAEARPRSQAAQLSPAALGAWHQTIFRLRADLQSWTARHSKHVPVSYPLITLLVCLMDEGSFRREVEALIDSLTRMLRDKNQRALALGCLVQAYGALMQRLPPGPPAPALTQLLAKQTKAVMALLRKGSLPLPEHHDMVREIWVAIAEHCPAFGLGTLLPETLAEAANWDVLLIGLRALVTVLLDAPGRLRQAGGGAAGPAAQQQQQQADAGSEELLDLVRNETQPLAAFGAGHLTLRFAAALAKVLQQCHGTHSSGALLRYARTPGEGPQPGRPPSMHVFTAALRCVPYLMPDHWLGPRLMEDLPGYTLNGDATIRAVAAEVLRRVMWALPGRRNEVVTGLAGYASRLVDDAESVCHVLSIVDGLMHEWIAILDARQQGRLTEPALPAARRLDLACLEGIAVGLLATNEADVRRRALDMLRSLRTLHRSLLAAGAAGARSPEEVNYLISIFECQGTDAARACYWDVGRWADLWRVWRAPGEDRLPGDRVTFEDSARRVLTPEDQLRWARTLARLAGAAAQLCPASATAAFAELASRFNAQMIRDPATGRAAYFPSDADSQRLDAARTAAMVALACPPPPPGAKPPPALAPRDIMRLLANCIRSGSEAQQQVAVLALGSACPQNFDALAEELALLQEEYSGAGKAPSSKRARGSDVRVQVAHVLRMLATSLPPGSLARHRGLRARMLEFAADALRFVGSAQSDVWPDVLLVRYCLCFVARCLAGELAAQQPEAFGPALRRSLFDALSLCCAEGAPGRHKQETARAVAAAKSRFRSDLEAGRAAEADVLESAECLEVAAHMALAALLTGASFDTEAKRHQGRAFAWIERMLTAPSSSSSSFGGSSGQGGGRWGPSRDAVARAGLRNLLAHNPELAEAALDRCYASHAAVSRAYFQVLVEVYAGRPLDLKPHLLLSLVLYKMVDPQLEVRDDALHMLSVLSLRCWREGMVGPRVDARDAAAAGRQGTVAVVVGSLQDTYQEFQFQVSAKLAREHPELSEGLCVEMMTRQLAEAGGHTLQHQVLTALAPWMENLNFRARWEGNWSESLLKAMYFVTLQHGGAFPHEIERLWSTVAANKRNVIPTLEFLISRGLQELNAQDIDPLLRYFDVGKRISLYLARMSPQQTIDHLAFEITQLSEADDEPLSAPPPQPLQAFEFGARRPPPSRHSSHSSAGGSSWHERGRSGQAQAAATGASGLAGLNLMPQSLLPEIMPDIPQMLQRAAAGGARRVSEMLRSASSARADVAESAAAAAAADGGMLRESADFSVASSRRASIAAPPVAGRSSMMRAEVAVCLLAEVAYEHDEDFRGHLPLLLHSMLLLLDSTDSLVFRHAQQVVTHLLYSLSVRHLELHRASGAMQAEYQKVTSLLTYLQTMRGLRLWQHEDVGLGQLALPSALALSALATAILESIFFERDLRERWAAEALRWMCESNSRHLACRSHQIYRALRPAASAEACGALLSCLFKCMAAPSQLALEVAADVMLTLQAVVEGMDESGLLLFPQLLLTTLALLPTAYTHLFALAVDLLQKILDRVDLNDATLQHVLLASTPLLPDSAMPQLYGSGKTWGRGGAAAAGGWPLGMQLFGQEALLCVQQHLVKGLFRPETELCTIEALACLADQVSSLRQTAATGLITAGTLAHGLHGAQTFQAGLGAVLGEVEAQLAIGLIAQLPWLCRHFRYSVHTGLASVAVLAQARACRAAGFTPLADALLRLRRGTEEGLPSILGGICAAYTAAFFPRFAKVALQRLMEALQKGEEGCHGHVLAILRAIFKVPELDLGCQAHYKSEADKGLLAPIASLLEGPHSQQALQVLEAVIEYQDRHPEGEAAGPELLQWPRALGATPGADAKASLEALGRLHDSWGLPRKQRPLDRLMPFIAGVQLAGGRPDSGGA